MSALPAWLEDGAEVETAGPVAVTVRAPALCRGCRTSRSMRPRRSTWGRRPMAERGQASVELVAAVPGVLLAAVLCLQLLADRLLADARRRGRGGGRDRARLRSPGRAGSRGGAAGLDRRPGRGRRRGRAVDGPTAPTVAVGVGRASARGQLDRLGPAPGGRRLRPPLLILSSELAGAGGGLATAAAVAVELAKPDARLGGDGAVLLAELAGERGRGPTMLAAESAREVERRLRDAGLDAAARGRLAWLRLDRDDWLDRLRLGLDASGSLRAAVVHLPPTGFRAALDSEAPEACAALLRAELPAQRSLAALAVGRVAERRYPRPGRPPRARAGGDASRACRNRPGRRRLAQGGAARRGLTGCAGRP